jgi:hypothetical protein
VEHPTNIYTVRNIRRRSGEATLIDPIGMNRLPDPIISNAFLMYRMEDFVSILIIGTWGADWHSYVTACRQHTPLEESFNAFYYRFEKE